MGQTCKHASSPYHKGVGKYLKKKMKWGKKRTSEESGPASEPKGDTAEERTTRSHIVQSPRAPSPQENMEAYYMRSPRSSSNSLLSMFNLADGSNEHDKCSATCTHVTLSNGSSPSFGPKVDTASERKAQSDNIDASYARRPRSPGRFILSLFSSEDGTNVHHKCKYASNPYHKCDETCIANEGKNHSKGSIPVVDEGRTEQSDRTEAPTPTRSPKFSASWLLSMFNSPDGNNVQKKCENASNPYHLCTEICTQMKDAGKKKGSKGLKSAAIHDIRDGDIPKSPRNVHPQCKYVDSPYHNRCTRTCLQRINGGYRQVDEKLAQSNYREISSSPHRNLEDPLVRSPGASSIGTNASDSNQSCAIEKHCEVEDQSVVIEYDKWIERMKGSSEPGLIDAFIPRMENFLVESPEVTTVEQYEPLPFTETCTEKSVIKEAEGEMSDSGQNELQPKFVNESDCDCTEKCIEEEGSEKRKEVVVEEGKLKPTNNDQNNKGTDPQSLYAHLLLLLSIIFVVTLVQSKAWSLWKFRKHGRFEDEGENK